MPYFAPLFARDPRRRRAPARDHLEALELRTMLSAAAAATAATASQTSNVPTITTLTSTATSAEVGQYVPLTATVMNAGLASEGKAATVQPTKGRVEFLTDSPNPIILGKARLSATGKASFATNKLNDLGPYQIEAEYLPANKFFASSTSAPISVTITPQTLNAPTVTSLQVVQSAIETGEPVTLNATVQNASSSVPDGIVKFTTVSAHPIALGSVAVTSFGTQVSFGTYKLPKVGVDQIQAKYVPNTNRFAESFSAPVTVAVTPLTVASFRVTPVIRHGKLNKPVSFEVTALNSHGQPMTNYTGTVAFTSPTDSSVTFPPAFYTNLHISASPPQTTGLATFTPQAYTFTTADQGSHTFFGAASFGKAGAETIKVSQANDPKVSGRATFAIE
jgi:Bacterial Ig-like domain (group 3)